MTRKTDYHHGDLRNALLVAAEEELLENGPERFSLRSCAKRAGVSHAAPAYHFKDTEALLQALAAVGFERLQNIMTQEQLNTSKDSKNQLVAIGLGYVRFGIENPQLLNLMFSAHATEVKDELLKENDAGAFSILVNGVAKVRGQAAFGKEEGWQDVTAIWSLAHGYAQLASANKMKYVTNRSFGEQRPYLAEMFLRIISS